MQGTRLPNINPLYQYSDKKKSAYLADLDLQEKIKREKGWKNFSKGNSLSKQVEPSMFFNDPYQKYQHYQLRGNNREEEKKFREINKKNLEKYNKKLLEQQKEELSKLHNFYQKAIKINKIKLPMIPNRFNIRPKQYYAEGHELEYQQALLSGNKKPSKEYLEGFNNDIKIKNANHKYLKKFHSNHKKWWQIEKKCWQIENEKQQKQNKETTDLLSQMEKRNTYKIAK